MNTIIFKDPEKLWFTSDLHLMHKNIIKYCERPFLSVQDMNEEICRNWNKNVKDDDHIIIAGDFCFGGKTQWREYLRRLKGYKYLVQGNHDKEKDIPNDIFIYGDNWFDQMNIKVLDSEIEDGQRITISHYAMLVWKESHKGAWQAYGHSHGNLENKGRSNDLLSPRQYDVGVDCNLYTPVSYQKLKEIITRQCLKRG